MENVIAEMLRRSKKSSWPALSRDICHANREHADAYERELKSVSRGRRKTAARRDRKKLKFTIERRKLQDLAEGIKDVPLSQHEFEVLDRYFTRDGGPGLAEFPLFRRRADLFRELLQAERASFFVGARYVQAIESETIARWDVSALNAMCDRIGTVGTESFFVPSRNVGRRLPAKMWNQMCARATGSAFVSIGSPLANSSSEYLLAEMFKVNAFAGGSAPMPPVCFVHADIDPVRTFARMHCDVDLRDANATILIDGDQYVSDLDGVEYGVVVAQRTGIGHTAFVVAGNSGPGTMAAAELFAKGQINVDLPSYVQRGIQPVLITVIATNISTTATDLRIDTRTVADTRVVGEPILMANDKGKWSKAA